jgi:hypothetical protein
MGAATLGSNLAVPNLAEIWFNVTAVLCAVVTLSALAMVVRPRTPWRDPGRSARLGSHPAENRES